MTSTWGSAAAFRSPWFVCCLSVLLCVLLKTDWEYFSLECNCLPVNLHWRDAGRGGEHQRPSAHDFAEFSQLVSEQQCMKNQERTCVLS